MIPSWRDAIVGARAVGVAGRRCTARDGEPSSPSAAPSSPPIPSRDVLTATAGRAILVLHQPANERTSDMIPTTRIDAICRELGLAFGTSSPGDGIRRYRFFKAEVAGNPWASYNGGGGIFTALGRKEALVFLAGYQAGRKA